MAAAVSDYRVAEVAALKRSKEDAGGPHVSLELVETEDILAGLVPRAPTGRPSSGSPQRRRRMPMSCANAVAASAGEKASICSP